MPPQAYDPVAYHRPHHHHHHAMDPRHNPHQQHAMPGYHPAAYGYPAAAAAAASYGVPSYAGHSGYVTPHGAMYYGGAAAPAPQQSAAPQAPPAQQAAAASAAVSTTHLPPAYESVQPHENDVLMGRGGKNNQHVGNERLRDMARSVRDRYKRSAKKGKSDMSRELVQKVRQLEPPGRFLKRNPVTNEWEDVGDEIAREKVSQVLRDAVSEWTGPKAAAAAAAREREEAEKEAAKAAAAAEEAAAAAGKTSPSEAAEGPPTKKRASPPPSRDSSRPSSRANSPVRPPVPAPAAPQQSPVRPPSVQARQVTLPTSNVTDSKPAATPAPAPTLVIKTTTTSAPVPAPSVSQSEAIEEAVIEFAVEHSIAASPLSAEEDIVPTSGPERTDSDFSSMDLPPVSMEELPPVSMEELPPVSDLPAVRSRTESDMSSIASSDLDDPVAAALADGGGLDGSHDDNVVTSAAAGDELDASAQSQKSANTTTARRMPVQHVPYMRNKRRPHLLDRYSNMGISSSDMSLCSVSTQQQLSSRNLGTQLSSRQLMSTGARQMSGRQLNGVRQLSSRQLSSRGLVGANGRQLSSRQLSSRGLTGAGGRQLSSRQLSSRQLSGRHLMSVQERKDKFSMMGESDLSLDSLNISGHSKQLSRKNVFMDQYMAMDMGLSDFSLGSTMGDDFLAPAGKQGGTHRPSVIIEGDLEASDHSSSTLGLLPGESLRPFPMDQYASSGMGTSNMTMNTIGTFSGHSRMSRGLFAQGNSMRMESGHTFLNHTGADGLQLDLLDDELFDEYDLEDMDDCDEFSSEFC